MTFKEIYDDYKTYEEVLLPIISNLNCSDYPIAFDESP